MNKTLLAVLSLAILAAGTAIPVWGAESVNQLIKSGETAIANATKAKAAQDDVESRNKQLQAEEVTIKADQAKLETQIKAFNQQQDQIKAKIADFKKNCAGKKLEKKDYDVCIQQQTEITKGEAAINAQQVPLVKQQDDFNNRVTTFKAQADQLNADSPTAAANYTVALNSEQNWLNQARNFLTSPALGRLTRKAHCADFSTSVSDVAGINGMSAKALDCLKRIKSGSRSKK